MILIGANITISTCSKHNIDDGCVYHFNSAPPADSSYSIGFIMNPTGKCAIAAISAFHFTTAIPFT